MAAEIISDLDDVLLIDTAILAGNRAPRGLPVMTSIASQMGTRSLVWRGGVWREQLCWTDRKVVRLALGLTRSARHIEVPNVRLFPQFFKARSVVFRVGMELGMRNVALLGLTLLRRSWPFNVTEPRIRFIQRLANWFYPFGTDRGGMRIDVVETQDGGSFRHEWHLIAEAGDGPFVPAVAARAAIRNLRMLHPDARPCLAEIPLADIETAMSDLSVTTHREQSPYPTPFRKVLADRWEALPPEVRALHHVQDIESFSGVAQVVRGTTMIARLAAWVFRFPRAGQDIAVTVTKTRTASGETWERNFNGRVFRSHCTPTSNEYSFRERFWVFNFEQTLSVDNGKMHFPVRRGWSLGIPILRAMLPKSEAREFLRDGVFNFDVALSAPLGGGLIVHYKGLLRPDAQAL